LVLAEGQYAKLTVKQPTSDLGISVFRKDKVRIAHVDSELRNTGEERLELVGDGSGSYSIRIEKKILAPGSYEISIQELRPATDKERTLHQAQALHTEAFDLYFPRVDVEKARLLAERSLQLYESVEGPEGLDVATNLLTLGWIHILQSDPDIARTMFERSVAIREKVLGPRHVAVAKAINELGLFWSSRGYYARAEALYLRALQIRESLLGPKHTEIVASINNLANLYTLTGNYATAKALYQRGSEDYGELLGRNHLRVGRILEELAHVYKAEGSFAIAESLYQKVISNYEINKGIDSDWACSARTRLADLYMESQDYLKAKRLYQTVLYTRKRTLTAAHPSIGYSLYKLGNFNFKTGDYEQAERFYLEAIAVWEKEKVFGPNYPNIADALSYLGQTYQQRRDYVKAETALMRALAIATKHRGPDHPNVAVILNQLAGVYTDQGQYERGEDLNQRALAIWQKANGPNHPSVANTFDDLGRIQLARGNLDQALEFQAKAAAVEDHNLSLNLATGSERWKLAYLHTLSKQTDRLVSLHANSNATNPLAVTLAASAIILRKGRAQDAMSEGLNGLRERLASQDQKLIDQLNTINAQLAWLTLNGPGKMNSEEHRDRIKAFEEQQEEIEEKISQRSAGYFERSRTITLASIQAAIPSKAALIEFAVYRQFDPRVPEDKAFGPPRYVAYVIRNQQLQWKELGPMSDLDQTIDHWRRALRDPKSENVQQLARAVDAKVMQPIRSLLGDATQLLISPDGQLNLIPFAALRDEHGDYLVERYAVTYLTSGRELLRTGVTRTSKTGPVVLANPAFGELQLSQVTQAHANKTLEKLSGKRQPDVAGEEVFSISFPSLGGTEQEALSIKNLFPEATMLVGSAATESAVKQVVAPKILHLATHGFFLQETAANPKTENPLLRSGLAFAGANERKSGDDDGILTALEATAMNLWGTKLVVLSACDTGVGEVRTGEGVYGLRRAFALAGAESVVMSLWPASDYVARKFMTTYYSNLRDGMGRGAALRQVQLSMLARNKQLHPFYWANFIQSGEWANLDGQR
jgi:CHAT domain-containing protein/Tfp pilus assembly protein PilF